MRPIETVLVAILVLMPLAQSLITWLPRHRDRVARRFLRHLGEVDAKTHERVAAVLVARERFVAVGMLLGTLFGLLITLPLWGLLDVPTSPVFSVSLAWAVGAVTGAGVQAVVEGNHARAPVGTRVALSTPPRLRWFVSRAGLLLLLMAAAVQVADGYLEVRLVLTYDGRWTASTVVAAAAMILLALVVLGTAVLLCWLLAQPFSAEDGTRLQTEVVLRRDQFRSFARLNYPLIVYVGTLVLGIDRSSVPFPVRSSASDFYVWPKIAALVLVTAGFLLCHFLPRDGAVHRLRLFGPGPGPGADADHFRASRNRRSPESAPRHLPASPAGGDAHSRRRSGPRTSPGDWR